MVGILAFSAVTIQIIQIATLNFSASFLSQNDEYWTDYYTKPWTRINGYLIGMLLGCNYFSFKYERDEENNEPIPSKITTIFI